MTDFAFPTRHWLIYLVIPTALARFASPAGALR